MDIKAKICIVVKAFLEHPTYTMTELANLPEIKEIKVNEENIFKYLNDSLIIQLFDIWTYNDIKNKLNINLQNSRNIDINQPEKTGSSINKSFTDYSKKTMTLEEQTKMNHIYTLTKIHLKYPKVSFEKIAELYNQNNMIGETITAEYVREILTSKACSNFFADNIWNYVPVCLSNIPEPVNGRRRLN